MQYAYTWLKAGEELFLTSKSSDGSFVEYGQGALVSGDTYQMSEGASGFKVNKSFLYMLILNKKDRQLTLLEANFGIIGSATPGGWDSETPFSDVSFDLSAYTVTFKLTEELSQGDMKLRFHGSWGVMVPYGDGEVKVKTDEGSSQAKDNDPKVSLSSSPAVLKAGGKDIGVPEEDGYDITFVYNIRTSSFSLSAESGINISGYPKNLFMSGVDFGNGDWSSAVELTPVGGTYGTFWTIQYLTAGNGFKFSPVRSAHVEFSPDTFDSYDGVTIDDEGNAVVATDGLYMIYIDMTVNKMVVEAPQVFGIGTAFGGNDNPVPFTVSGEVMEATTLNKGELRMYASSSLGADLDWTQMEFRAFEDKIEYRGKGGEFAEKIVVSADALITLDFTNNTSIIDGEVEVPSYPTELYMIGADFGNWGWGDPGIVEFTPVNGTEGAFWTIKYLTAEKPFKFSPVKAWGGDFGPNKFSSHEGVSAESADEGANAVVTESGLYMIYIDLAADKMVVEAPKVYGIGSAFGAWAEGQYPFTLDTGGHLMSITVPNSTTGTEHGLRMYATSSLAVGVDAWKMEFMIYDGKIEYRGNGGDQEPRVEVVAGEVVTLDFANNTGTIE